MIKLIFKAYKKLINIFFIICFLYIKITNKCYHKYKEKLQKEKRKQMKDIQIVLKNKNKKVSVSS